LDVPKPGSLNHVCGAFTSWECDDELWFSFIQHFLISDHSSGSTKVVPVGRKSEHFFISEGSPNFSLVVGASCAAVDDMGNSVLLI
jgi:hypothetical protein